MQRDGINYILLGHYYYTAQEKKKALKEFTDWKARKGVTTTLADFWDLYGKTQFGETPWAVGGRFEAGNLEGSSSWNFQAQEAYKNLPFAKFAKFHSTWKPGGSSKGLDAQATYDAMQKRLHDDKDYVWNLPPHRWSILDQSTEVLNPYTPKKRKANFHSNRRGVIRWMGTPDTKYAVVGKDGKAKDVAVSNDATRKYGFQFLWNPETYQTTVAFNSGVVPTIADQFTGGAGFFPGFEQVSFTLRLDRTNDFACFKALGLEKVDKSGNEAVSDNAADAFVATYYPYQKSNQMLFKYGHSQSDKLRNLMQLGTLADLDYLYRTINGDQFINTPGKYDTADMGFLMMTIVKIELGPASYVGYITGISIDHQAFTEGYIPIRTDVSITINILTNAAPKANDPSNDPNGPNSPLAPGNPSGTGPGGKIDVEKLP